MRHNHTFHIPFLIMVRPTTPLLTRSVRRTSCPSPPGLNFITNWSPRPCWDYIRLQLEHKPAPHIRNRPTEWLIYKMHWRCLLETKQREFMGMITFSISYFGQQCWQPWLKHCTVPLNEESEFSGVWNSRVVDVMFKLKWILSQSLWGINNKIILK
jgi:hypothetical protein